jgi:hypothetical protein
VVDDRGWDGLETEIERNEVTDDGSGSAESG